MRKYIWRNGRGEAFKKSVVINPLLANKAIVVRIKFQCVLWTQAGQVSRIETIKNPQHFQDCFTSMEQSIFLSVQQVD